MLHGHLAPLVGLVEGDARGPRGAEIEDALQEAGSAEDRVATIRRNPMVDLAAICSGQPTRHRLHCRATLPGWSSPILLVARKVPRPAAPVDSRPEPAHTALVSLRRKLAIATWTAPREGNIFGKMTLDATNALRYLDEVRERTGEKVTITALVGRVVGEALKATPSLNGRILFGQYVPHANVDVSFLVSLEDGNDLAKAKVSDVDKKGVAEISKELTKRVSGLRDGKDPEFEKSKGVLRILPVFLLKPLLFLTGWLTGALGIGAKPFGLERFPFGAAIITNVGVFGLDEGFVPQTPFARVPLYVLVGAVRDGAAVVGGELVIHPQVTLCATLDHRFIDGAQIGTLAKVVRERFENPWSLEPS